jgi:hypothetical protein
MVDSSSPYLKLPPACRWRESVSGRTSSAIDPHLEPTLRVDPSDRLASAGSCFAQRISDALRSAGYNYLVLEEGPPFLAAEDKRSMNYGVYSARYGNVYTTLQLVQLFRRAFGRFNPGEPVWRNQEGGYVDPYRPAVQPGGFVSESECLWDRRAHLDAVRRMFLETDVFIFTLGLTECWLSALDGAVFPICPGSGLGGIYDSSRHLFHNFSVEEVAAHLETFVNELQQVNAGAKIILTVSPVPLMATFEPRHVLQSTVYSKSVLRVACEQIVRRHSHVHYFASYEIVTASGDSQSYFQADRRTVTDIAVAHVMDCFCRQFMGPEAAIPSAAAPEVPSGVAASLPESTICDEALVMAALAEASIDRKASCAPNC